MDSEQLTKKSTLCGWAIFLGRRPIKFDDRNRSPYGARRVHQPYRKSYLSNSNEMEIIRSGRNGLRTPDKTRFQKEC